MSASIERDDITFEIEERTRQVPHVLTEAEIAAEERRRKQLERPNYGRNRWDDVETFAPPPPEFDTVRTVGFGLEIHGWGGGIRRSWWDGKTQTLETMIDQIVDGFEAHIAAAKHRREENARAEAERQELARRRGLAKARRERESNRKSLISRLMRTERQAALLRERISACERHARAEPNAEFERMMGWAHDRLRCLESIIDPAKVAAELHVENFFRKLMSFMIHWVSRRSRVGGELERQGAHRHGASQHHATGPPKCPTENLKIFGDELREKSLRMRPAENAAAQISQ
jgi:hypothetical protein